MVQPQYGPLLPPEPHPKMYPRRMFPPPSNHGILPLRGGFLQKVATTYKVNDIAVFVQCLVSEVHVEGGQPIIDPYDAYVYSYVLVNGSVLFIVNGNDYELQDTGAFGRVGTNVWMLVDGGDDIVAMGPCTKIQAGQYGCSLKMYFPDLNLGYEQAYYRPP
jgi:hypothetical protein